MSKLHERGGTSREKLKLPLEKSLYGLKQTGPLLSHLFHEKLSGAGFKQSLGASCLCRRYTDNGDKFSRIESTFVSLMSLLMKNLGPVSKVLGM